MPGSGQAPTFAPGPEQPQPRPTTPVQAQPIPAAQPAPAAPAADDDAPKPQVYVLTQNNPPAGSATTRLDGSAAPAPAPVKAAPAPTPKPVAPAPTTVTPGNFVVQIGAVSSTALANTALAQAASIAGGGHGKSITPVTVNGATLYRTAVTGFTTKEAAIAYCNKLKAAGKSCFVR
jgi:cell division protein FtsN